MYNRAVHLSAEAYGEMADYVGKMSTLQPGETIYAHYFRTGVILPVAGGEQGKPPGDGAGGESKPADGESGSKPGEGGEGSDEDNPESWDAKRAAETIRKQRESERTAKAEAAKLKKDLETANKRLSEVDAANLSDKEKAEKAATDAGKRADDADQRLKDTTIRYEVQLAAAKEGAHDPDDIFRLIDRAKIEYEDDGTPKNVGKLVGDLLKAKPWLKKGTSGTSGNGHVPPSPRSTDPANLSAEVEKAARAEHAQVTKSRF